MSSTAVFDDDLGLPIESGDWAGWRQWISNAAFEEHAGPFYTRREEDGGMVCGFRVQPKNMNGGGSAHGGALMTFADYSMFLIAYDTLRGLDCVTVSMSGEFLVGAPLGALLLARGEVLRSGGSLVFVRGLIAHEGRPVYSFSGVIKAFQRKVR